MNVLLVFIDLAMIIAGFVLAWELRYRASDFVPLKWMLPLREYIKYIFLFLPVWLGVFAALGLYAFRGVGNIVKELFLVLLGVSATLSLMIIIFFFNRDQFFSRLIIIYAWLAVAVMVMGGRLFLRLLQKFLYRYGLGLRRIVIVGSNGMARQLVDYLDRNKGNGWELVGVVDNKLQKGQKVGNYRVLGDIKKLSQINKRYYLDEVWLAEAKRKDDDMLDIIRYCEEADLTFRFVPSILEVVSANIETQTIAGMPLIALKETALEGWGRIIKRIGDVIFSLTVILLFWWLFVILAIWVKLDSEGPIFYGSIRVGRKGRLFKIWKFRTMVKDADKMKKGLVDRNEADGPMFKIKDDPRITGVGKFLRRTRIDELPQVWNVLMGDMSWIGPRPPLPDEVKQYEHHQLKRLAIKSGITGPWQVTGRHDLTFDEIVKLDTYYIENWSLMMDAQIFLRTIWLMLTKEGR